MWITQPTWTEQPWFSYSCIQPSLRSVAASDNVAFFGKVSLYLTIFIPFPTTIFCLQHLCFCTIFALCLCVSSLNAAFLFSIVSFVLHVLYVCVSNACECLSHFWIWITFCVCSRFIYHNTNTSNVSRFSFLSVSQCVALKWSTLKAFGCWKQCEMCKQYKCIFDNRIEHF